MVPSTNFVRMLALACLESRLGNFQSAGQFLSCASLELQASDPEVNLTRHNYLYHAVEQAVVLAESSVREEVKLLRSYAKDLKTEVEFLRRELNRAATREYFPVTLDELKKASQDGQKN